MPSFQILQKLRALSPGGSKKIENQRIASGNLTRLGTIKETFEELLFLQKQLLVSEVVTIWQFWQKTGTENFGKLHLRFFKENGRVGVLPLCYRYMGKLSELRIIKRV